MMAEAGSMRDSITDVPGIKVGHAQDETAVTGCTVILCEAGAVPDLQNQEAQTALDIAEANGDEEVAHVRH